MEIKLLEHMMKVYERIIDSRIREQVAVDEIQFGFMPGKGTADATFILRQTQEKALEGNRELFIALALPGQQDKSAMWSRVYRIIPSQRRFTSRLYTESVPVCSRSGYCQ